MLTAFVAAGAALFVALVAAPSAGASASGKPLPGKTQTDSFGTVFREVGADDFTKAAPLGSWEATHMQQVVYTGDHGMEWWDYPNGAKCLRFAECYMPSKVLSVHGGVLDYWLHRCSYTDGFVGDCAAAPQPIIPAHGTHPASEFQTYGRYEVRMKVVFDSPNLADYHIAWLLWPKNKINACGESDFPEGNLRYYALLHAFAHYGCDPTVRTTQDRFARRVDLTKWHTFTQEWGPGWRRYYLDDHLLGVATHRVWSHPERWSLQIEPWTQGDTHGHVLVDWVWIGTLGQ